MAIAGTRELGHPDQSNYQRTYCQGIPLQQSSNELGSRHIEKQKEHLLGICLLLMGANHSLKILNNFVH